MDITAIIRDRGQLTIPDKIRDKLNWLEPLSPVTITIKNAQEIVISPPKKIKNTNWTELWKKIKKSRAIKGKNKISLSEFIIQDRQSH